MSEATEQLQESVSFYPLSPRAGRSTAHLLIEIKEV
jgi:hypothetical protein